MKTILAFTLLMTASASFAQVTYSNSAYFDLSHSAIRLSDVSYRVLPSKLEVRPIPGCRIGNSSRDCSETVVLAKEAVVQVSVSFNDGIFRDSDVRVRKQYATFNFRPENFSAAQVEELKLISKWDLLDNYKNQRLQWAHEAIELKTAVVVRDVQVIDVRNSTFCPIDSEPYPRPGCVETIIYKSGKKTVREVKVVVK